MMAAARWPADSEPAKSQFLRLCKRLHSRKYAPGVSMYSHIAPVAEMQACCELPCVVAQPDFA